VALTLNNFWGAETGGSQELYAFGNAGASTLAARTGTYGYRCPWGSNTYCIFSPFESIADAGSGRIFGFYLDRGPGTAHNQNQTLITGGDFSGSAWDFSIIMDTSNNLIIRDSAESTIRTLTNPLSDDTFHLIEIYWTPTNSGTIEVFIDGVSQGEDTGQDLLDGATAQTLISIGNVSADSATNCDYDDLYFMSGATSSADRLGGCEVISYRSNLASATADNSAVLDSGLCSNMQNVPFSDASSAKFTGTIVIAALLACNDVGGSAGTGGPRTDTNITGTIKGLKGVYRLSRSGGGGTAQYGYLGKANLLGVPNSIVASPDFDISTSAANYIFVSTNATRFPDPTTEYLVVGMGKDGGGQDIVCYDMLAQILHVPSTSGPLEVTCTEETLDLTVTTGSTVLKGPFISGVTDTLEITTNNATILVIKTVICPTEQIKISTTVTNFNWKLVKCQTKTMDLIARSAIMSHISFIEFDGQGDHIHWRGNEYGSFPGIIDFANTKDDDNSDYGYCRKEGSLATGYSEHRLTSLAWEYTDATLGRGLSQIVSNSIVYCELRFLAEVINGTADVNVGSDRIGTLSGEFGQTWSDWIEMPGPGYGHKKGWGIPTSAEGQAPYNTARVRAYVDNVETVDTTEGRIYAINQRIGIMAGVEFTRRYRFNRFYGYTDTDSVWTDETLIGGNNRWPRANESQTPQLAAGNPGSKGVNDLHVKGVETFGEIAKIAVVYARFGAQQEPQLSGSYDYFVAELWDEGAANQLAVLDSIAPGTPDGSMKFPTE